VCAVQECVEDVLAVPAGCGLFDCLPWNTAVSAAIMFTGHGESKTRDVVLPSGQIALGAAGEGGGLVLARRGEEPATSWLVSWRISRPLASSHPVKCGRGSNVR